MTCSLDRQVQLPWEQGGCWGDPFQVGARLGGRTPRLPSPSAFSSRPSLQRTGRKLWIKSLKGSWCCPPTSPRMPGTLPKRWASFHPGTCSISSPKSCQQLCTRLTVPRLWGRPPPTLPACAVCLGNGRNIGFGIQRPKCRPGL